MTIIKSIDHVNIVVSDLKIATDFFTMIGFTISNSGELESDWVSEVVGLQHAQASYVQLSLPHSRTRLELIQYFVPKSNKNPSVEQANQIGIRHLAFEVSNIDSIVTRLKNNGQLFFSDIKTYEPLSKRLVYFYGPDSIILELAEYLN